ncbi:hypothetical protein ACFOY4_33540 [Actinomadura syzygii]|uniref:DUF3558 domain-containing protein n=1 Tax=Actinomadura syzygii TaxID=1427538 RepID=A0A5D0UBK5_9ACTN|nr:hypothetical protein [Actinomadura syzygii]TYC15015.1 hypothetical protein FXF65_12870 [Actinomadura syzygii]
MKRIAVIAALAIGLVLTGCATEDEPPAKAAAPSAAPSVASSRAAGVTARQIAERLAKLYPLPNPTDNTGSCAAKPGDTGKGCKQLITTDAVSIYEFEDPATATRWVKAMKANGDWRQVGRYALAWTARDQRFTSKEARTKMAAEVRKMIGG